MHLFSTYLCSRNVRHSGAPNHNNICIQSVGLRFMLGFRCPIRSGSFLPYYQPVAVCAFGRFSLLGKHPPLRAGSLVQCKHWLRNTRQLCFCHRWNRRTLFTVYILKYLIHSRWDNTDWTIICSLPPDFHHVHQKYQGVCWCGNL